MKVMLVNGSPHEHGCTDAALREVAHGNAQRTQAAPKRDEHQHRDQHEQRRQRQPRAAAPAQLSTTLDRRRR